MDKPAKEFDAHEVTEEVADRVKKRMPDLDDELIHREAAASVESHADARVTDFIGIIAERETRERLAGIADEAPTESV
ncbi:three-helix bundle dimerization domain-containing protein [Microbacterium sp. M4A5_1d]